MNSNWKEEAWKTEVHVMADRTIKTKIEGREIYDWSEQHHRTGNKKNEETLLPQLYTEMHEQG